MLSDSPRLTKAHYHILLMSWAGWLFDFYDLILYSFLLIPISQELGFTKMEHSLVLGTSLAMTAVGGILFGFLSDKFGRKRILQWTIFTYSVGTFMCGFTQSLWWLLLWRSVTGLGVGGEWATAQTYIGETFPPRMRGRFGAYVQTGAPIGIALATVVGSFVAPHIGWRASFIVSFLPALLIFKIRKDMPESDLWIARKNIVPCHEEKNSLRDLLGREIRRTFLLALVLTLLDMSAYWFTYTWLPSYLHEERGFSLVRSGLFMLVTQLGGVIGYVTFGHVADRLGRRPAYTIYSVVMAAGLLMITLFWSAIAMQPKLIFICMFVVGLGTGMFGGYGPLFSEIFPTRIRNTAMGTAFNLARGVQFFTPVIITMIATRYGLEGGISLAALFALLTGLWIWVFPETKGKSLSAD
ncbi:MAG: MFS transporter [Verrucomicrobia bacterium]|nr:MFS transporter [Verrucomicrobiota bacterium]